MLAKSESPVALATSADEGELMSMCRMLHSENGMAAMDDDMVRAMLHRAFNKQGGIIGVIRGAKHIEGAIYLLLTSQWYTKESHLEELFSFVHPDHRRSNHAEILIGFAKSMSDLLSSQAGFKIPLIIGILTNSRMAGKVRLYRRSLGYPSGALFAYNGNWKNEPAGEDFWNGFPDKKRRKREVE